MDHGSTRIWAGKARAHEAPVASARVEGRMRMGKIGTGLNPADLLTKSLPCKRIQELCHHSCTHNSDLNGDSKPWTMAQVVPLREWHPYTRTRLRNNIHSSW